MAIDKKRKLRRTARVKIEGKNGRPMCWQNNSSMSFNWRRQKMV